MAFGFHGRTAEAYNRSLLKKRPIRTKNDVYGKGGKTSLDFKKSTKKEAATYTKRDLRKQESLLVLQLSVVALLVLIILVLAYALIF
ncbi:hypothetical protein [Croceivirga thetidis]|uniref:Riboflavin synthase subunit beta n=1 Tax=Croceivirga thetidis TaxID=2721623 RepID=A0ABX1GQG7_9FLAO|nr:hypothetical protein [Croceivirga thetidis]NKI32161.1 hypothetical protein [Croceivirga thetidis]